MNSQSLLRFLSKFWLRNWLTFWNRCLTAVHNKNCSVYNLLQKSAWKIVKLCCFIIVLSTLPLGRIAHWGQHLQSPKTLVLLSCCVKNLLTTFCSARASDIDFCVCEAESTSSVATGDHHFCCSKPLLQSKINNKIYFSSPKDLPTVDMPTWYVRTFECPIVFSFSSKNAAPIRISLNNTPCMMQTTIINISSLLPSGFVPDLWFLDITLYGLFFGVLQQPYR